MTGRAYVLTGLMAALLVVSACDRDRTPQLLNVRSNQVGPDEFAVLPSKPLTMPDDLQALPEPTPGGSNRTDATPLADAVLALGGRPDGGIRDGSLVQYASRYGVAPDIRASLAAEDLEFRRRNDGRLLERLFNVNVYNRAYSSQSLDQFGELDRLRRSGVRTVSAPPAPSE